MKLLSLLLSITLAVTQNVDSIVNQSIQSGDIPGAVVCYVENDSIVFIKGTNKHPIITKVYKFEALQQIDRESIAIEVTEYETLSSGFGRY